MKKPYRKNHPEHKSVKEKPKQKYPIGRYIMFAIIVIMVLFYLIYVNGFMSP